MTAATRPTALRAVSDVLARDRLGIAAVFFFVLAGVAPLTVVAGVVPTAYGVTGLTSIPAAFITVAAVLALFAVGYMAMARHIANAGAFYAFISRGLGRPLGVAASLQAVIAYNLLQVGLYGAFGAFASALAADLAGIRAPWWVWALAGWAAVAVLGLLRVDFNGRVLAVLGTAEIIIVVAFTVVGLSHPADGEISFASLSPVNLFTTSVGAAMVIAVLGFVGFEAAAVFAEECKNPRRTLPIATYLSLGLIAVVYTAASWAMAVAYGDDRVVSTAQQRGPEMLFGLASGLLANVGRVLVLTSVFAAMLAFHNAVGRYMFALGRERVLPAALGRTSRSGAPKQACLLQSAFGLAAIVVYAGFGWDPIVRLFYWLGTTGALGILILLTVTSAAVVVYFARHHHRESRWRAVIAPGSALLILAVMVWQALTNYSTLLGVPAGTPVSRLLPGMYAVAATIGVAWALILKARRIEVYAAIGLGANAATGRTTPAAVHRPTPPALDRHADRRPL